jgi:hypothetical protein
MLTWFLRWPTGIDNLRWGFSLCIPHRSCPCMDARWRAADVVVNVRRPSRCPGCLVPRYRPSSKILVNYYLVMPRHLMFVVSETWGLAPIRWGWEEWAQGAERTRSAFLCRGIAGGLGARSPAAIGPPDGPIANLTVGFFRLLPAGAGQGNPRPDGSAARRMRASVHMIWPLPSRRTRAGMVDTPKRVTNALPSLPAAVACGTAVHLGIE